MKNILKQLTGVVSGCLLGNAHQQELVQVVALLQQEYDRRMIIIGFSAKGAAWFQNVWKVIAYLAYTAHIARGAKQKKLVLVQLYRLCSIMQQKARLHAPGSRVLMPTLIPPLQLYKKLQLLFSFNDNCKAVSLLQPFINGLQTSENITWLQWLWWCSFYQCTAKSFSPQSQVSLEQTLVDLNFNTPVFKQYLAENLKMALLDAESLSDKISLVRDQFLKYRLQQNAGSAYIQHETSVHDFMLHICRTEMKFLNIWATHKNPQPLPPAQQAAFNLQTCLTVSQAALLVRLHTETGIIRSDNHTVLLKHLAAVLSTPHTGNVSAESLRIKFYTPDKAAKDIMKDYLFMMINKLRDL